MYLHIYKDAEELTDALANWMEGIIEQTLKAKEKFTLALSGGETPKLLYTKLAAWPYNEKIAWNRIEIFWGDERIVPFDDDRNNAKMAYDYLLNKVSIPAEQIHKIWTDIEPEDSAKRYDKILHSFFDNTQTTFDLVLLGMGEDGHTLSLFPGSTIPDEQAWVNAIYSEEKKMQRITLMPSVVNKAASVVFMVTGSAKSQTLKKILDSKDGSGNLPARLIQPANGELHWFADADAAKYLDQE